MELGGWGKWAFNRQHGLTHPLRFRLLAKLASAFVAGGRGKQAFS